MPASAPIADLVYFRGALGDAEEEVWALTGDSAAMMTRILVHLVSSVDYGIVEEPIRASWTSPFKAGEQRDSAMGSLWCLFTHHEREDVGRAVVLVLCVAEYEPPNTLANDDVARAAARWQEWLISRGGWPYLGRYH